MEDTGIETFTVQIIINGITNPHLNLKLPMTLLRTRLLDPLLTLPKELFPHVLIDLYLSNDL
jgi:hypothetical protein